MSEFHHAATGIFVASSHSVSAEPGGQQICTREYIDALELAGFTLERVIFSPANGIREKLLRRVDRRPYRYFIPRDLVDRVIAAARSKRARYIFLNTVDLAPLATDLKERGNWEVVMLSHGLESVDYIHTLRTQNWRSDFSRLSPLDCLKLGQQITEECRQRRSIDKVLCLAEFEAEIERWLGSRDVLAVPRTIRSSSINWSPIQGRVGFVGRLDHPPNLEGLRLFLEALAKRNLAELEVRVVGAPRSFGMKLERLYPFVSYLGVLSDSTLAVEAATWTCATNPIFCYARGASTKLAVMAGWGIPLITTPQGERGYEWRRDRPISCSTPDKFAEAVEAIATDHVVRNRARESMMRLQSDSVDLIAVSSRIRSFLLNQIGSTL